MEEYPGSIVTLSKIKFVQEGKGNGQWDTHTQQRRRDNRSPATINVYISRHTYNSIIPARQGDERGRWLQGGQNISRIPLLVTIPQIKKKERSPLFFVVVGIGSKPSPMLQLGQALYNKPCRTFQHIFLHHYYSSRLVYICCIFDLQCWNFGTAYGSQELSRNRVVIPARQDTQACVIDSLESIPGLLKSFKMTSLYINI